jgi:hypothetical protein
MKHIPSTWLAVGALALAVPSCSSVPDSASTGFDVQKHGFSFENYGGESSYSSFGKAELLRMFGQQAVCVGGTLPCNLKPGALAWAKSVNQAMDAGRCEGFAVLSQLFFTGALKPSDFGADSTFGLDLGANEKLGNELAFWFGSQMAGSVLAGKTQKFEAKNVMPFLADILSPNAPEAYRLGIVNKRGKRVLGGHALTPISYERVGDGIYDLRVYDNNFPGEVRVLQIDTGANRWTYQGSLNPSDPGTLFFGDNTNKNSLIFAPVKSRIGTFACKFCDKGGSKQVVARASGDVAVSDASGNGASLKDGELTASGAASVDTAAGFAIPSEPLLVAEVPDNGSALTVSAPASSAEITVAASEQAASLKVTPFVSEDEPIASDASAGQVTMTLDNAGSKVTGNPSASTQVGLSRTITNADGTQKTVEISVQTPAGANVQTGVDDSGKVRADVTGGSGAVTMQVTQTTGETSTSATFTTDVGTQTGGSTKIESTLPQDPNAPILGTATTGNGETKPLVNLCTNGVKDATEVDVDCGGTCGACEVGKACRTATDCASGACNSTSKVCVASLCEDGSKNGSETDIDCGGTCAVKCGLAKTCATNSDCAQQSCDPVAKKCRAPAGDACTVPTDCASGSCLSGVCIAPPPTAGMATRYSALNSASVTRTGTAVTAWADISGNGHTLSVGAGSPTYNPTLINGLPGIDFGNAQMLAGAVVLTADVSVFAVFQHRTPTRWGPIIQHGDRDFDWSMEQSGDADLTLMHWQSANDLSPNRLRFNVGANYINFGRIEGNQRYFSQTAAGSTQSVTSTGNTITPGVNLLSVGGSNLSEFGNHYVGELIYYTRAVSDAERDAILRYLSGVWGI